MKRLAVSITTRVAVTVAAAVTLLAVTAPDPARAAGLEGHRAIYSVRLGQASTSSQIVGVEGASLLRMERACDGWISSERLSMVMEAVSGGQVTRDIRFTGWESFDGRSYKFASRSQTPAGEEAYRGTARIADDGSGEATFTDPEEKTIPLPEGTLFYAGFTRWVLEMTESGRKFGETVVFDGADGEGAQKVTVFLTKAKPQKSTGPDLGPLGAATAYNARMAFYEVDSRAAEPEFEIEARLLANGVATRLVIEFSDFSIIEEIQQLEAVAPADC